MAIYITDENGKPKRVAGNCGLDPRLASKDLANVTYPTIVYDESTGEFDENPHFGAGDRVVERFSSKDGKSWYEIYASGRKRCGMYFITTAQVGGSTSANFDIALPVEFKTTNYSILITHQWLGSQGGHVSGYYHTPTKNSFTLGVQNNASNAVPTGATGFSILCEGY